MSTTGGRRVGITVVLVLLAGAAVLAALPFGAGAVRVGALSLLWWYTVIGAPCIAVLVASILLTRRPPSADPTVPAAPPS